MRDTSYVLPALGRAFTASAPVIKSRSVLKQFLRSWVVTLAVLLPVALNWGYKVFMNPRPYWVRYYDPEMFYFYGGLGLLAGRLPDVSWVLSAPVYLLSAGLLYLKGYGPLDVEDFRVLCYIVAGILWMVAAFLLLHKIYRNLPLSIQIAGLWTFFQCPMALHYNNILSPEMFYFPAGVLVVLIAWGGDWNGLSFGRVFGIGLAVGLCSALKLAFLSFALALGVSLILTPRSNLLERLYASIIGFCGVISGFVLTTIIAAPLYPRMFRILLRFATHKGEYGSGAFGLLDSATLIGNLHKVLFWGKGWNLWLMLAIALVGYGLWRERNREGYLQLRLIFLTIFSFSALTILYLLAIRMPTLGPRYLLPNGIIGLLLFAVAMRLTASYLPIKVRFTIMGLAAVLLFVHTAKDINSHRRRTLAGKEIYQRIRETLTGLTHDLSNSTIIYSYRVEAPSVPHRFLANKSQLRIIETRFPREGHYDHRRRKVYLPSSSSSWDYLVIKDTYISSFPEPLGPVLATLELEGIHKYHIIKSAGK